MMSRRIMSLALTLMALAIAGAAFQALTLAQARGSWPSPTEQGVSPSIGDSYTPSRPAQPGSTTPSYAAHSAARRIHPDYLGASRYRASAERQAPPAAPGDRIGPSGLYDLPGGALPWEPWPPFDLAAGANPALGSRGTSRLSATPVITFDLTYGRVTGYTDPNSDVHLVLWRGAVPAGEARMPSDAVGYFLAELMDAGRWAQVQPGDTLDVVVNGITTTLIVPALSGVVDPGADTVTGSIGGVTLPADLLVDCLGNRLVVNTDAAGDYSADLSGLIDVSWWDEASVGYQDTNGNWLVSSFAPQNGMVIHATYSSVHGYTVPGATVTVTVNHAGDLVSHSSQADPRSGWWSVEFDSLDPGDEVTALVGNDQVVDTVSALTAGFDLPADLVFGTGPANAQVSVISYQWQGLRRWQACRVAPTNSDGSYVAAFALEELETLNSVNALHHDTALADTLIVALPPLASVDPTRNQVWGYAEPGALITATLSDNSGVPIEELVVTARSDYGHYRAIFGTPFQPGYQVHVIGGGLDVAVNLATLTVEHDLAADQILGQAPANAKVRAETRAMYAPGLPFRDYVSTDPTGTYELDLAAVLDIHNGRYSYVYAPQGNDVDQPGWLQDGGYAIYVELNEAHNSLMGYVPAENAPLTLTLRTAAGVEKAVIHAQSDGWGYFGTRRFYAGADLIDIEPGDQVVVDIAGWSETVVAPEISIDLDLDTDRVTGTGPANSFVEVYARSGSPQVRVPTDGDGHFLVDFAGLADLLPWTRGVEVAVYDDHRNRLLSVSPYLWFRANTGGDWVDATTSPYATVWMTATDSLGNLKGTGRGTAGSGGWFPGVELWLAGQRADLLPGDIVYAASSDGSTTSAILAGVQAQIDADADTVSGQMWGVPLPGQGYVEIYQPSTGHWTNLGVDVETDGTYLLDLSGQLDIQPRDQATVWYVDPTGPLSGVDAYVPYARANVVWDAVDGWFGDGVTVWFTVTDRLGEPKGGGMGTAQPNGWLNGVWCGCDLLAGDQMRVRSSAGFNAPLVPISITGHVDVDADTVSGQMSGGLFPASGYIETWSNIRQEGLSQDISIAGDGSYFVDLGGQFDLQVGDRVNVWVHDANGNDLGTELRTLSTEVNYGHDWVYAATEPHTSVVVTVVGKAIQAGEADSAGNFYTHWAQETWVPGPPDIQPGDVVMVTAAGFESRVDPVGTIAGTLDLDENTIAGTLTAPCFSQPLHVRCEVWVENGPPGIDITVDPDGGSYVCDLDDVGWDLLPGQDVAVRYFEPDGDAVINVLAVQPLGLRVILPDQGVHGFYEPGHTVWLTVTESDGVTLKATAVVTTSDLPWGIGFQTEPDDWSPPGQPQIQPYDRVYGRADNGLTSQMQVGIITGQVSAASDSVSGTVYAPWFSQSLDVDCHSWGRPGEEIIKWITVLPDGVDRYTCTWDPDTEWDILPGQIVGVGYSGTDGNWVANAFQERPPSIIYLPLVYKNH